MKLRMLKQYRVVYNPRFAPELTKDLVVNAWNDLDAISVVREHEPIVEGSANVFYIKDLGLKAID